MRLKCRYVADPDVGQPFPRNRHLCLEVGPVSLTISRMPVWAKQFNRATTKLPGETVWRHSFIASYRWISLLIVGKVYRYDNPS